LDVRIGQAQVRQPQLLEPGGLRQLGQPGHEGGPGRRVPRAALFVEEPPDVGQVRVPRRSGQGEHPLRRDAEGPLDVDLPQNRVLAGFGQPGQVGIRHTRPRDVEAAEPGEVRPLEGRSGPAVVAAHLLPLAHVQLAKSTQVGQPVQEFDLPSDLLDVQAQRP
jgi:hypothetical protein